VPRDLDWDGCYNVRDLGGIPVAGGRRTRWGAIVRADSLHKLTADGWSGLVDHGVRTVIDLRNDFERVSDVAARPAEVVTVPIPLDGMEDREFWDPIVAGPQFGTPIYYRGHLERMPERSAAVLRAIARARPGGVAFHCVGGRDRTGQITILLLALAGVSPDEIVADYERSDERLVPMWAANGGPDEARVNAEFLAGRQTTASDLIVTLLETLDLEGTLRAGGLSDADASALRTRLVGQ
jgi:protein-tyrosine phosphatase